MHIDNTNIFSLAGRTTLSIRPYNINHHIKPFAPPHTQQVAHQTEKGSLPVSMSNKLSFFPPNSKPEKSKIFLFLCSQIRLFTPFDLFRRKYKMSFYNKRKVTVLGQVHN